MVNPADLLRWGAWRSLAGASHTPEIPHRPGRYRIRRMGRDDLDSIGQTGMGTTTLRKQLGMLRRVNGELIPLSGSALGRTGALGAVSPGPSSVVGLRHSDGRMHAEAQRLGGTGHRLLSAGTSSCGIVPR